MVVADEMTPEERRVWGMQPIPVEAVDREGAIQRFVTDNVPVAERPQFIAELEDLIDRLLTGSEPDDELWLCRSRDVGPGLGHEGLGLVRDGEIVWYEVLVQR
jgi:hypothetical protein